MKKLKKGWLVTKTRHSRGSSSGQAGSGLPTTGQIVWAIGKVTFQEIVRDRILYNSVACAFLLLGVGFLASRMSFIRPERILLDFGLAAVSLSCCTVALLLGAGLLNREFERRTLYVALSHPISRVQFLLGKFFGLVSVIGVNWILLSAVYLGILSFTAGESSIISGMLALALFFSLLQSILVAGVAILFSTLSTTSLSVTITLGIYLIGTNISQLRLVATKLKSGWEMSALNAFASIVPNLEAFSLGTKVTYNLPVSWQFIVVTILYAAFVVAVLLTLAGLLIQGREV